MNITIKLSDLSFEEAEQVTSALKVMKMFNNPAVQSALGDIKKDIESTPEPRTKRKYQRKASNLSNSRVFKNKDGSARVIKVAPFAKWLPEEDTILDVYISEKTKSKKIVKNKKLLARHSRVAIYSRWNEKKRAASKNSDKAALQFFDPASVAGTSAQDKSGILSRFFNV